MPRRPQPQPDSDQPRRRPVRRHAQAVALVLVAVPALVLGELTPWLGWALGWLAPTTHARVITVHALAAVAALCLVGARRYPGGVHARVPWSVPVSVVLAGMVVLTPVGHQHVTTDATVTGSTVGVTVAVWAFTLAVLAGALHRSRPRTAGLGGPVENPSAVATARLGRPPLTPAGALAAAAVPAAAVVALMALGAHLGEPWPRLPLPGQDEHPVRHLLAVPALDGTDVGIEVVTTDLTGLAAGWVPESVAHQLTGAKAAEVWENGMRTAPAVGAPGGFHVIVTVDRLEAGTDPAAAAAQLATTATASTAGSTSQHTGPVLPNGWAPVTVDVPAAAVLDGRTLLVLRLIDDSAPQRRQAELVRLAGQLTPARRTALVQAVTAAR